jgi:hypothetical protein
MSLLFEFKPAEIRVLLLAAGFVDVAVKVKAWPGAV